MSRSAMSISLSEITAGLVLHGFSAEKGMATITSGGITIAVLDGDGGEFVRLIIRLPNGKEIFCRATPNELLA